MIIKQLAQEGRERYWRYSIIGCIAEQQDVAHSGEKNRWTCFTSPGSLTGFSDTDQSEFMDNHYRVIR